jgi:carboxylesterase
LTEAFRIRTGSRAGLLLIHGFTGTPHEMRGLGDALSKAGYAISGVRLSGHGARQPGEENDWRAWRDTVDAGLAELRTSVPDGPLAVVGLSMGALLALDLAQREPDTIRAVTALSPAIMLPRRRLALLWLASRLASERARRREIKKRVSDIRDPGALAAHPAAAPVSLAAVLSFDELRRQTVTRVAGVHQPLLIVHAQNDRPCTLAGAHWLARHVGSADVEVHVLPLSGHVITVDFERERVASLVEAFLERTLSSPARATA